MRRHQIIPTSLHGVADYGVGVLLIVAPYALGFADGGAAQYVPQAFGAMTILMALLTRYELGLVRVIPMRAHLLVDAGSGFLLAASPWLFNFADRVYLPHLIVGLLELLIVVLSQTEPHLRSSYSDPLIRKH
jgi:hypothetical protein